MAAKMSVAKQRWFLVKDVLRNSRNTISQSKLSGRQFQGYSLLFKETENQPTETGSDAEFSWQRFSVGHDPESYLDVRIYSDRIKIEDLTGFNNTGNVCVWPSEDVLAHYLWLREDTAKFRRVCELGGGMTCLAGLAAALKFDFDEVLLTDGNEKSVARIGQNFGPKTCMRNAVCGVSYRMTTQKANGLKHFDLIIIADCLFFKEYHTALLETISSMLQHGGLCVIIGPQRGDSLSCFVEKAQQSLNVKVSERYDEILWQKFEKISEDGSIEFKKDQHYPFLIEISKINL